MKDMKEQIAKSRKVALYMNMEFGDISVHEVRYVTYDVHYEPLPDGKPRELPFLDGYARVTEPVEVSFKGISQDEIVAKAVESINETERKLMVETEKKLAELREKKQQLLALTHQMETV